MVGIQTIAYILKLAVPLNANTKKNKFYPKCQPKVGLARGRWLIKIRFNFLQCFSEM
jgi:hypothetical protein